ncbi:hypothetical protein GCM10010193_31910 [Kitasatospora atroaurantiaca]
MVDIGVDGDDGASGGGQMADEQGGQRGLAAAALADEGDLHLRLRLSLQRPTAAGLLLEIVIVTDSGHAIGGLGCRMCGNRGLPLKGDVGVAVWVMPGESLLSGR